MVRGSLLRAALAFAFLATLALGAAPLAAQAGQVTGRVLDAATGRPVAAARVTVQGLQLAANAGVDGRYTLTGVPAGPRTLTVAALGYASKTVTGVVVPAGGAVTQDVSLSAATLLLESVTVTAQAERGSVTQALDEQRTAMGVVNALGAEQIARSPDSDAAQAIRRVSGVTVQEGRYVVVRGLSERYTTAALNGARIPSPEPERRVVPLDMFPAGLLQTVSTTKTFTPNLAGDFSGALVNIRTREYPTQPIFSLSSTLGYNPDVTGRTLALPPLGRVDYTAFGSDRGLPSEVAQYGDFQGRTIGSQEYNRMVNSFRGVWLPEEQTGGMNGSLAMTLGGTSPLLLGRELGYVGSFSYSRDFEVLSDHRRAQVLLEDQSTGAVRETDRFVGDVSRVGVLWGGVLNLSTSLGGDHRVSLNNTYNRSSESEARADSGSIELTGLELIVNRLRLVERSIRSNQLRGEHGFGRGKLEWTVTSSGVTRAEPDRSEWVLDTSNGERRWYAISNEAAVRTFGDLSENSLEGGADYHLSLGAGERHRLSFGGMVRRTDRDAENTSYSISALGLPEEATSLTPAEIFDGRYTGDDDRFFLVVPLGVGGSYAAEDRLAAGYGMLELALTDRVRVIGGARVERSEVTVTSDPTFGDTDVANPVYTDVLPALAVNVDLTDRQKVRFSASQTLARPEYRELSAIAYRDVIGEELVRGNGDLRRTLIQNLDARWEWYPGADEVVSLGVFAKRFDGPIERIYLPTSGSRIVSFANAERAVNYGVELELRKSLGMLGSAGESWSVITNATLVRSDVRVVGEDADRPMVGQSPYVVNAGLAWSPADGRTSATVLYNLFGRRITSAGAGVLPDVYEQPRGILDLSLRHGLGDHFSLKLDAENLLDAEYEFSQGGVVRESYRTGRSVSFGVSWRR
ncbi:MAG TPA: TonB-dependent receptor [Longimicrobium sp.]|nr:TonB-dependent receptor [Longimicrobium sp.]